MSTQVDSQREQRWQETADKFSHVADRLGKTIDAGILETVVVLNILGIPTIASCEGHIDWGTRAPWVDIASTDPATHVSIAKLSTEALQERERDQKTPAEIAAMFEEVHKIRRAVKVLHIQERQKLLTYLATFYEDRHVSYDRRLIIRPLGTDGKSRLESQGADCQEVAPLDTREKKLREYQEEMQAFTTFLKEVYYTFL